MSATREVVVGGVRCPGLTVRRKESLKWSGVRVVCVRKKKKSNLRNLNLCVQRCSRSSQLPESDSATAGRVSSPELDRCSCGQVFFPSRLQTPD